MIRITILLLSILPIYGSCRSEKTVNYHKQKVVELQEQIYTFIRSESTEVDLIAFLKNNDITYRSISAEKYQPSISNGLKVNKDEHVISFTYYEYSWPGSMKLPFVTKYLAHIAINSDNFVRDVSFFEGHIGL